MPAARLFAPLPGPPGIRAGEAQSAIKAAWRCAPALPPGHDRERSGMLASEDTTIEMRNPVLAVDPE